MASGKEQRSDYHDHVMKLLRTPSVVTGEVPRYGNAPMLFTPTKLAIDREAKEGGKPEQFDNCEKPTADRRGFTIFNWKSFF